ncbi:hypothetical protein CAPTEDRAFT_157182 [Capitella teleta]|uniref:Pre-mRNA-splicing factor 18 n=1 Tax=Capitella teleta TaxID=283909 RepID=R7U407_CAPTE|nr:hypothetical protein CAPTEDRAFT_157182 [Capitella teleta]|eukprot:ELU00714.1 hypothetical protein CAPTEDRAFT_157182 [Capitella teleta]
MDFLKEEIARKKRQLEEKNIVGPNKKYFKRRELAEKETEEYWKKNKRIAAVVEEEKAYHSPSSPCGSDQSDSEKPAEEKVHLSRKEVVRRLRERNEPIRLFGESDNDAYQRLRKHEISQPEINKGLNNDFKAAMDKVDQDYLKEITKSTQDKDTQKQNADVNVKDDGTTYEEILDQAKNLGTGDEKLDSEVILKIFKLILKKWGDQLNNRDTEQKRSFHGKLASAAHSQTVSYIKPLFRKLKRNELPSDLLECLADIVKHLLDRHYLKANDAYLEMAIGNAPWPIGVTMVGIHARTGREKISARNVAHVLNDETQRKYIQAVKRLLTQCQKIFPTDPSRCVDFEPDEDVGVSL